MFTALRGRFRKKSTTTSTPTGESRRADEAVHARAQVEALNHDAGRACSATHDTGSSHSPWVSGRPRSLRRADRPACLRRRASGPRCVTNYPVGCLDNPGGECGTSLRCRGDHERYRRALVARPPLRSDASAQLLTGSPSAALAVWTRSTDPQTTRCSVGPHMRTDTAPRVYQGGAVSPQRNVLRCVCRTGSASTAAERVGLVLFQAGAAVE